MLQAYCHQDNYDAATGTCAVVVWSQPTGFLPPLSVGDALQLSAGFAGLLALAWSFKQVRRMIWK